MKDANYVKYVVAREDGHRFYFRVSYYGLFFFILSATVYLSAVHWLRPRFPFLTFLQQPLVDAIGPMLKEQSRAQAQVDFLCICLFTVFLGRFSPPLVNFVLKNSEFEKRAVEGALTKDELEGLLVDALAKQMTILVTMSSGKVYVGWPLGTAEPRAARKAIAMLPLISGYRDNKQEAQFTTHYDRAFDPTKAEEADRFRLVLHVDKIVAAAFFDIQTFEKFKTVTQEAPSAHQKEVVDCGEAATKSLSEVVQPD